MGELIARTLVPMLPGSIFGMVLLFLALQLRLVKEEWIESTANFILRNMAIIFLPPSVGIIVALPLIEDQLLGICLSIVLSTAAVIISVGLTHQLISKRKDGADSR